MKRQSVFIALIAAAMAVSCNNIGPEEALLPLEDISLTIKGEKQFNYSNETSQSGFNDKKIEFRATEDKLAQWFILDCNELPTNEGQQIKATLKYNNGSEAQTLKDLEFVVKKTSPDGLIWLWNSSHQIGIVVKQL